MGIAVVKFTMTIETDGHAFDGDPGWEISRIVHRVVLAIANGRTEGVCLDINGNRVGEWRLGDA